MLIIFFNSISMLVYGQITFIIESLPNATPEEDTIFICGTFNNWNVHDKNYILHPQLNGSYSTTFQIDTTEIQYKFSRGNWMKVETDQNNEYLGNRIYNISQRKTVLVSIQNWQDLGGIKKFNYLVLPMFAFAFLGIIFLIYIMQFKAIDKVAFKSLFILFVFLIIALGGSVLYARSNIIEQSHIAIFSSILPYLWAPIVYLFFYVIKRKTFPLHIINHFLPAFFVFILSILRLISCSYLNFFLTPINVNLTYGSELILISGLLFNFLYYVKTWKLINFNILLKSNSSGESNLFKIVFSISLLAFFLYGLNLILLISGSTVIIGKNFELIFLAQAIIMIVVFYYYEKFPKLFFCKDFSNSPFGIKSRVPQEASQDKLLGRNKVRIPSNNIIALKERIIKEMELHKSYKNPELNVAALAKRVESRAYIVSGVLHQEFNENFRDFINKYRINEFVALANSKEYKNYTFLALCYEVGFNSKSTFNLAFKKSTGVSPSAFLKKTHIQDRSDE